MIGDDIEYLFWVGCAGALEDRAKKTTKAIGEIVHTAGVKFAVLGPAETCTGDPARRMGDEFVYSMLAQANVETLNGAGLTKPGKTIVASCPHCFNTIANEYPKLDGNYQVIHHTQLLAKLVEAGKLTPVTPVQEKNLPRPVLPRPPTRSTRRPARSSTPSPAPPPRRCTGARTAASAAARAAPGCGWKNASANGSTPSASTRPSP